MDKVDWFLDQTYLVGGDRVHIVHGHGKGILRNAIPRFLEHHPQVARFAARLRRLAANSNEISG